MIPRNKRVAIIGIDGGKPAIVDNLFKKGLLPNLAELKDKGTYSDLESIPTSQSPVAWSTIITGLAPSKHGVFDYLIRNPKTMQLKFGMNDERFTSSGVEYVNLRKGKAIWEMLGEKGNVGISLFVPMTFPADDFNGFLFSGMGLPDVRGTQGVPTLYSNEPEIETKSDIQKLIFNNNQAETELVGVSDIKKKFILHIQKDSLIIKLNDSDDKIFLKEGQWSNWITLTFDDNGKMIDTLFRFKLLKFRKGIVRLYLSPIMYSPSQNFIPFSSPVDYGAELFENTGNFKALSFESDVYGLKEKLIDEETWLEDMKYTFDKRIAAAKYSLTSKPWKFFVADFFSVDRAQHLFWRSIDKKNELYDESKDYDYVIDDAYVYTDEKIGELLKCFNEDDLVFVVSDHGFCSYRKNVELNKILMDKGFLKLKDDKKSENLNDIDWSKTKAYALGFGAIYINLEGRELKGIVKTEDYETLRREISEEISGFSFNNEKVINDVLSGEKIHSEGNLDEMPDLVPIYADGFRSGRASTLGLVSLNTDTVHSNLSKWSGDHIGPFDLSDNFGFLFSNQILNFASSSLFDLSVTSLDYFGVEKSPSLKGKSLLE
ncbi:MAG: alkaline phosphatase family protein [Candidatus Diapherotrites archaeon]